MTLPDSMREVFKIYSTDLYWIQSQKLSDPWQPSMSDLIDDIMEIISQLGLKECLITGFSCFGILALEAAKRRDSRIKGVLMVSTPPGWNDEIILKGQVYFEENASAERKLNDVQRKAHYTKIKKPDESLGSINAYEADAARYWQDFNLNREFFELLWQDIQVDDAIINYFFSSLLPKYNLAEGIDAVDVPVILFSGESDYDSLPAVHWLAFPKPPQFVVINCPASGHWPQLETPEFFARQFNQWLQEHNFN